MKTVLIILSLITMDLQAAAVLQSLINTTPAVAGESMTDAITDAITPGTPMKLVVQVENVGNMASKELPMFVRFSLPYPLSKQPHSVLYESEQQMLPILQPGEAKTLAFAKVHVWPSLFDFVRNDWAMRQYEAVICLDGKEFVSGTGTITFSATYYEGPSMEIPVAIDGIQNSIERKLHTKPKKICY